MQSPTEDAALRVFGFALAAAGVVVVALPAAVSGLLWWGFPLGEAGAGGRSPLPGDMRHSFAVSTVADWHSAGAEVEPNLPLLSTYLGHVNPASTYWYLSASPRLLTAAASRLERTNRAKP